jgi:hypothetical protein
MDVGWMSEKSEVPGRTLNICLPLADIKRLSEDFVGKKYGEQARKSNAYRIDTRYFFYYRENIDCTQTSTPT